MHERLIIGDPFQVIDTCLSAGLTFESMMHFGLSLESEAAMGLTPARLAVWYLEEKERRTGVIEMTVAGQVRASNRVES
jgi:hypothetical protein